MFGPKSPAYTIGKAQRVVSSPKQSPGPGDYTAGLEKAKGLTFTRSPRTLSSQFANPGPGEYNVSSMIGTGPKSIIIPRRLRRNTDTNPGPGDYSPKNIEKTAAFTFKKQTDINQSSINPGPGAYSPISPLIKAPVAIFSRSKRTHSNINFSPGPGRYNIEGSPKSCEHTFGKAKRELSGSRIPGPGPGDYSPYCNEHTGASAIIIPRRPATASSNKDNTPGPGTYSCVRNSWDAPKWTIPKSPKDSCGVPSDVLKSEKKLMHVNNTGSTEITARRDSSAKRNGKMNSTDNVFFTAVEASERRGPSAVFGTSRRHFVKVEKKPGPGQYDTTRSFERRGFTFTRSTKIRISKFDGPGPGRYNIPHTIGT